MSERVLVIDDSPIVVDMVAEVLEAQQLTVETAASGAEGLEKMARAPVEVVVCDLNMPGMSGLEFFHAARAIDPDVPLILLSGENDVAVVLEAVHAGVFDYVQKSQDLRGITASVGRALWHVRVLRDNRRLTSELQSANEELAQRVEARTAQLLASVHAMKASREQFRALVETTRAVPWEMKLDEWRLTYVGPQAEAIFGHAADAWFADDFWQKHLHPDDRAATFATSERMTRDGLDHEIEFRLRAADARWLWVRMIVSVPREERGGVRRGVLLDVTERHIAELKVAALNKDLIDASRKAGMAEVATSVLHNVGNVLNSVNVSSQLLAERIKQLRIGGLGGLAGALKGPLPDDKRQQIAAYVEKLAEHLVGEQQRCLDELSAVHKHIEHIKTVVSMQQAFGRAAGVRESLELPALVEDAAQLIASSLNRASVELVREFSEVPPIVSDRHRLLEILANLLKNAGEALGELPPDQPRRVTVRLSRSGADQVAIEVRDSGVGIAPEILTKIFSHGFTTKKNGHGFGLHASALAARELGGELSCHSDGIGRGACFKLTLPAQAPRGPRLPPSGSEPVAQAPRA